MTEPQVPTILCVDDEPSVLEGLALHLQRRFRVVTATSGAAALQLLQDRNDISVIVSDMRMPVMDGATFLNRSRLPAPDASRILLTGQADMESAILAVNEGQIFRFLTKPCPPATLLKSVSAGVDQNRLVTAERVLLEETLRGSIKALTDILSLANPTSFGRATRLKQSVIEIANRLGSGDRWQLEVAAMLSQIGFVALPAATVDRLQRGESLSLDEMAMVERVPEVAEQLLKSIPRLEVVRTILATYHQPYRPLAADADGAARFVSQAAQILRVAVDYDALELRHKSATAAREAMQRQADRYDSNVFTAWREGHDAPIDELATVTLPLEELRIGMVIAEDVFLSTGVMLVARGYEVTPTFVERARNFRAGAVAKPVMVFVSRGAPQLQAA